MARRPRVSAAASAASVATRMLNGGRMPESAPTSAGSSLLPGITAVLCTRIEDREGFPRVPSLVASLVRFAAADTVMELLVSSPEKDVEPLRAAFGSVDAPLWRRGGNWYPPACRGYAALFMNRSFGVRVVSDRQVLPSPRQLLTLLTPRAERAAGGRGANYRMQMLIKLGVSRLVRTRHYLTLDSDVFAKRPFGVHDLLPGGKVLIQGEVQSGGRSQHRRSWWESSGRVFGAPRCVRAHRPTVGVTPALLVTEVALGALRRVEEMGGGRAAAERGGRPWDALLFQRLRTADWTEYTLYWTYACATGQEESMHSTSATAKLYRANGFSYGAWMTSWRPEHEFGSGALFGVVQSIGGARPLQVAAELQPYIVGGSGGRRGVEPSGELSTRDGGGPTAAALGGNAGARAASLRRRGSLARRVRRRHQTPHRFFSSG